MAIKVPKPLNTIAKDKLKIRRDTAALKNPGEFSIIFLGDPHVGYTPPPPPHTGCFFSYSINGYKALLKSINSNDKTLIAVFNGGDGANDGNQVKKFVSVTKAQMNKKNHKDIPFFSGVGNHEYINDFSLTKYKAYISKSLNDVIHLYGNTYGPKVAVIMLNTGTGTDGCVNGISGKLIIKESIDQIKKSKNYMSAKNDKSVKFIIDMHIPPNNVAGFVGDQSHVLCDPGAQGYFHSFVQSIGPKRILAIVCHHRHGVIQPTLNSSYYYSINNVPMPVFLTAQGGNCDWVPPGASRTSYYKFHLATKNPASRSGYFLKMVDRLNVNVANNTATPVTIYP